jgi:hypothetical protein
MDQIVDSLLAVGAFVTATPCSGYMNSIVLLGHIWLQPRRWRHTLLWAPHHAVSIVCLLLAWVMGKHDAQKPGPSVVFIAIALASTFGLSIYVAFVFFLVMLLRAVWELAFEYVFRPEWVWTLRPVVSDPDFRALECSL